MSVAEFVAGVDRLLTRAHELFPAAGNAGQVTTGAGGSSSIPAPPKGASGLGAGASSAAGVYEHSQAGVAGLDGELEQAAAEGGAVGEQGRTGSGLIRDQARTVAASTAPLGNSAAGAQLIVAAMDEQLAAMQGQLQSSSTAYEGVAARLGQVAAGYQTVSAGGAKDSPPGAPLDSHTWKPGDKRHRPYIAGPGGLGPPNYPDSPPWIDIWDRSGGDPDKVPHYFVRSDEIPDYRSGYPPGGLGPPNVLDEHGNPDPWIELGPNTGVYVPKSDFPGAIIIPPGSSALPPYGYDEYLPGSGIFVWRADLLPEPYNPSSPLVPPPTYPQSGR